MTTARAVVCVALFITVGLLLTPTAGGFLSIDSTSSVADGNETATENASMGQELSTFMQSNDANTAQRIDAGMFDAAYDNADAEERADLVGERTNSYATQLEALEAEYDELGEHRDNMHPTAYDARMTRLAVQLSTLEQSLNETETRAQEIGLNTTALTEIRANASALNRPDVAEHTPGVGGMTVADGSSEHRQTTPNTVGHTDVTHEPPETD